MEFFLPGTLCGDPSSHDFRARWYGKHLDAMQESPLHTATAGPEVYRLLFLPTFSPPHVVRLEYVADDWRATFKRSNGLGGYEAGSLEVESTRPLFIYEKKQFVALLEASEFWTMASFDETLGLDGSQAVIEGVRDGRYHVVDRWTPHGTPYARLVECLLQMTRRRK
jgi:hypothetical protein